MVDQPFAVIIPVGPSAADLACGAALLWQLLHWEPTLAFCVIAEHSPIPRGLSELAFIPRSCRVVTLTSPTNAPRRSLGGALTVRVLNALSWVQTNTNAAFVLKIDTDALVIAPFAEAIQSFLCRTRDAGIVGTLGLSCNPEIRAIENLALESRLLRAHRLLPSMDTGSTDDGSSLTIPGLGTVSATQLRAFHLVRPHIAAAASHGYTTSEFCQGGAYVITRLMLDRMAEAGYLRDTEAWQHLPFSEDRVTAMYAKAVGLTIADHSKPGQPFGVNWMGLAYPPTVLAAHKYSFIHSVKNDYRFSEPMIRHYFQCLAIQGIATHDGVLSNDKPKT
jgi:hypothetical protein